MSHNFLEGQVHSHRKCFTCRRAAFVHKGRTYSLCTTHLAKARDAWRLHCRRQVAKGRCINCQRRKLPKELRCARCKEINRVRALTWMRQNPERSHQYWLQTRSQYIRKGLCVCKGHPKLPPGYNRCDGCRKKQNALNRAIYRRNKEAR